MSGFDLDRLTISTIRTGPEGHGFGGRHELYVPYKPWSSQKLWRRKGGWNG